MFRIKLDLQRGFCLIDVGCPLVNDSATDNAAPMEATLELGHAFLRIIQAMATTPVNLTPFMFVKLNIKDGFWRMGIPKDHKCNFACVPMQLHMCPTATSRRR
jgi:hypothetical protein